MLRVDTFFTGSFITGGGMNSLFFNNLPEDATPCVAAVQDFWDNFEVAFNPGVTFEVSPVVTQIRAADGALEGAQTVFTEPPKTGDAAGDPLPRSQQLLVRMNTSTIANRRLVRGRIFIPGLTEANNGGDGRPLPTIVDGATAAAEALMDDLTAQWCVWHRPPPGSPEGGSVANITGVSTWSEWAVLRSRRD